MLAQWEFGARHEQILEAFGILDGMIEDNARTRHLAALLVSERRPGAKSAREWEQLADDAVRGRLAPLLFDRLRAVAEVPETVRERLRRELYETAARNAALFRDLGRALDAARDAGTDAPVVLKGAALASTLYGDVAHRPMCDVDVLVRRDDLEAWADTLVRLGYEPLTPEMAPGLLAAVHYQRAYRGGDGGESVIELHWSLIGGDADWRAPAMDWFWGRTEPWLGPDGGPSALQLHPTANLAHLCAHAFLQHGQASAHLSWLYDVHRLVDSEGARVDWQELCEASRRFQWDSAVADALELSRRLFCTALPDEIVETLRAEESTRSSRHVRSKAAAHSTRAAAVWRELSCLDLRGRLRLAFAILFPAPSYVKWRYPKVRALWPLGYPYRWAQVLREGIGALLTKPRNFVAL